MRMKNKANSGGEKNGRAGRSTRPRAISILAAGAAIQILTGIPAAWGVFQQPVMEEYGFSQGQAGAAFSLLIAAFGVGCVLGGFLQDRHGPRVAALAGTALLCGAFFGAAVYPTGTAWLFWLGFSLPAGLGCAFLYPSIQSCAQKWYADRKGLATGVIGGAVGLSGAFLTFFVRRVCKGLGPLQGIRGAFWGLGALTLPVCLAGSLLLKNPPAAATSPQSSPRQAAKQPAQNASGLDYPPRQMLRTRQYWLCAAAVCFSTPAVLLFSPIIIQLGTQRGLSEEQAAWAVVLGSVGSAAGRLLMPLLSDKIGRRRTDLGLFAASLGLSVGFAFAQSWGVVAVYAGLTFCYSGLAAVLPAFSTDLFGLPHAGVNYGFLALGQSVGSLTFPLLAQLFALEQGRHWLAAAGAALGFAAVWRIRPTQPLDEKERAENENKPGQEGL
jgi:OFA family oxalate/formate antiporter-like MFS transporter